MSENKKCSHCAEENTNINTEKIVEIPSDERLGDLADLFKMFSDYSRVKLLTLLIDRELCVCDLTELMHINQSAISNHLRLLRASKLVKSRRSGKNVYYSLADNHVKTILKQGMDHYDCRIEG